ncbi:MAG TPA: hypothetical protein PLT31_05230 [Fibrobacteraceae bacterium]|nr:hypothetical protein [Fibrobacteraceae bacterium]
MRKIIICLFLLSTVLCSREIQILSSNVIDVEDETIVLVEQRVLSVLDSMGFEVVEESDLALRTVMMKLGEDYLLYFEMTEDGKVVRSQREKLESSQNLEVIVSDLLDEMFFTQTGDYKEDNRVEGYKKNQGVSDRKDSVLKSIFEEDKDERRFYDDEEESFAGYLVAGVFIIAYKLTLHILVSLSDYIGLEASLGGVSAFSLSDEGANSSMDYKVGAQVRSSLFFGFNERHSWGFGLNFVKNPSEILNQHLSFLSTHRFYVNKYFFFDFVWGYGFFWYDAPLQIDESLQLGWSFGGDVGYNIIQGKKHWLSLVIGFQHIPRDDMAEKDELSLNLVYTFRGYFEE